MLTRTLWLLVFLITMQSNLFADVGRQFCMRASITLKNGAVHSGYFGFSTYDLAIEKDEKGFYYSGLGTSMRLRSTTNTSTKAIYINETDYHFHTYVKRLLVADSVRLFEDMMMIEAVYNKYDTLAVPAFIGNKHSSVSSRDIHDITIDLVYLCSSTAAIRTRFSNDDRDRLRNGKIVAHTFIGPVGVCDYDAFYFEHNKDKANNLIEALKLLYERENLSYENPILYNEIQLLIHEKIEALKKENVIVVSFCSC